MYIKLIFRNAARSAKDYLIYLVTMTICVTLFYAFLSVSSRYYHPDIGAAYDITMLNDGMKMAVCTVTLLLLFLIRYVNSYMLRRRQKEFAVQAVCGMEQNTIGWIFFAETFLMGGIALVIGIALGVVCSQFITAMLLNFYDQSYEWTWTLFPDTVLWTIGFFFISFLVVGLFQVRSIRKIKIIDMLSADKQNEPALKKSRFMTVVTLFYVLILVLALENGIRIKHFYFDSRFALPVHLLFWGNIVAPALGLLWVLVWLLQKRRSFCRFVAGELGISIINAVVAAGVPGMKSAYFLSYGTGVMNQYLTFLVIHVSYLVCCVVFLANTAILAWKNHSPRNRYQGQTLFLLGQITTRLVTNTKTMILISLTLALSIVLFLMAPILTKWASGYLDVRSLYDVQINSRYNHVYEESDLPAGDYEPVTDFLDEHGITKRADCTFSLYLPKREEFHHRRKPDFPVAAISLRDYNALRQMLGYASVTLQENEFTTQWKTIVTEAEREAFLNAHQMIETDGGNLTLSGQESSHRETMGETLYNSYTEVLYVFPDNVCRKLLPVMRNRYIITEEKLSYQEASALEQLFTNACPEESETGVSYFIRMNTLQVNESKAERFVMQTTMIYGAVVLLVICLTILSLQQLLDAGQYGYRFSVLQSLGVEERDIKRLILKQLSIWFGLPITVAVLVSGMIVGYFLQVISAEISAYIGMKALLAQVSVTALVLVLLLVCYFASTWVLFQKSIEVS